MIIVNFHNDDEIDDSLLKFAVISARYKSKWVFCRHKKRDTFEIPGGHRENGEYIDTTAKRELMEETGAKEFAINPVCIYSVTSNDKTTYRKLFFADIKELECLQEDMEISETILIDKLPEK